MRIYLDLVIREHRLRAGLCSLREHDTLALLFTNDVILNKS